MAEKIDLDEMCGAIYRVCLETPKFFDACEETKRKIQAYVKQEIDKLKEPPVLKPSFWFMFDNCLFTRLVGNNIQEIKQSAIDLARDNPYGSVCPVTLINEKGEDVRKVGEMCHVDKDGNVNLDIWFEEIIKEDCIRLYKSK